MSGRSRRAVALVLLSAVFLLAGPFVAKSHAGTYTSQDCAAANGGYSAAHFDYSHAMGLIVQACGNGNGLGMALPTNYWSQNQTGSSWNITTPAGTHFTRALAFQRGASDPANGWEIEVFALGPTGGAPLGAWKDGSPTYRGITSATGNYNLLSSRLTCVAGGGCYGSSQAGIFLKDLAFDMVDDSAPRASVSGELLGGELQRGTGGIDVSAEDVGAGLTQTYVAVNDQVAAAQSYGCPGLTNATMQPCTLSQQSHFQLDTQKSPFQDGTNELRACAVDYATSSVPNVGCGPTKVVQVDNSCPASKVPGGSELTARFPRSDKDTITVRSRRSALVAGRLTDRGGEPLAGAALCVREAMTGGSLADVGTVKTNDAGRYRYTVGPGPSREIEVAYRYNRHQLNRNVHYRSKVTASLKLSHSTVRNGRQVRLFGRLPGPVNDDRIVILQARYPGAHQRWKTFQKARTIESGQYSALYRFESTFVTTRYEMRAVVPAQKGYPFLSGHSPVRSVRVVGR